MFPRRTKKRSLAASFFCGRFLSASAVAFVVLNPALTGAAGFTAEELISRSEVIVDGQVTRSRTAWDARHKYIWTHYAVAVSETLRGTRTAEVTVSEPGGSLDGINQGVSGAIAYRVGETAVLCLYRTPIGYWRVVGGPQGRFMMNAADSKTHLRGLIASNPYRKELR